MPSENKYEIRSQEVQEVLSTPPRFLTLWGNLIVIGALAAGFLLLGRYKVMRTVKVPVQIANVNGKVGLIVDPALSGQVKVNQQLKLQTGRDSFVYGSIAGVFDTTIAGSSKKCLMFAAHSSDHFFGNPVWNGGTYSQAEIQTGETTFLRLFLSK